MELIFLVPYYAPDLGPSAPLFTLLAEELAQRGHRVIVIAAVPHYPTGRVPEAYCKQWIQRSTEHGVEVTRVRIPSVKRSSMAQRLMQYLAYQIGATWAGIGQPFDAAFIANPALWTWLPFTLLVALRHKPALFSVQDVYPDVGVALGIFHNKPVIDAVASIERFCLNRSSIVQTVSSSFKPGLQALGVPDSKMRVIYNWVDTGLIKPMPKDNGFSREFDLANTFNVLYAGNIGLSQRLEYVLEAAAELSRHRDLKFVFVGDGASRDPLMAEAQNRHLTNVQFLPFQSRSRLPEVLASADVSIVSLQRGIGTQSIPSKLLSTFASGRPVLASIDEGCETWKMIEQAEAGICVPPENAALLAEAILHLKENPPLREAMGCNGRIWAEQNHSPAAAAQKFEALFKEAVSR